jgi:ketosteroid isomerase-like protein
MTMAATKQTAEDEIRGLLDTWADATRAKDIEGIIAACAQGLVTFDCHGPLHFVGAGAYRKHLEACFPYMQGPMTLEIRDLDITAEGDVGFGHYFARCGGTGLDGTEHSSWFRGTTCFRRTNGTWKIVHEHLSAPFNAENGTASLGLEP